MQKKGIAVSKAPSKPVSQTRTPYEELPYSYNKTVLVLMVRDPHWAFAYWDFSAQTWHWLVDFREKDRGARPKLRVHQIDRNSFYDVDVYLEAKNWYLELGVPDSTFEVELGIVDSSGRFHRIALSNRVKTPRNGPSVKVDPNWEITDEEYAALYKLSGGQKIGSSSEFLSSFSRR